MFSSLSHRPRAARATPCSSTEHDGDEVVRRWLPHLKRPAKAAPKVEMSTDLNWVGCWLALAEGFGVRPCDVLVLLG
eukprot:scaffold165142_cov26-Tisochrysis_lutea.AAC.4